jgi:hypothetical protein
MLKVVLCLVKGKRENEDCIISVNNYLKLGLDVIALIRHYSTLWI